MLAGCDLHSIIAYLQHTCVPDYGLQMSQLDVIGLACAKLRHRQEIKVLHCYLSI